ncbi:MAG TPA: hypothetical protein VFF52_23645 [Isosphaeraceae bacterium]|nr:hypothetical protein [Isosphaeraceae bacterium]
MTLGSSGRNPDDPCAFNPEAPGRSRRAGHEPLRARMFGRNLLKGLIMARFSTSRSVSRADLPEHLALTGRDRRLESMILLELIHPAQESRCSWPGTTWASLPQAAVDDPGGAVAARVDQHAMRLARFLAGEARAVTLEQKVFIAELAAEIAQRLGEEFPRSPDC